MWVELNSCWKSCKNLLNFDLIKIEKNNSDSVLKFLNLFIFYIFYNK